MLRTTRFAARSNTHATSVATPGRTWKYTSLALLTIMKSPSPAPPGLCSIGSGSCRQRCK
jgi:hypothetical protein